MSGRDWNTAALAEYEYRQDEAERIEARARAEAARDVDGEPEVMVEDLDADTMREYLLELVLARRGLTGTDADARAAVAESIYARLRNGAIEEAVAQALDASDASDGRRAA